MNCNNDKDNKGYKKSCTSKNFLCLDHTQEINHINQLNEECLISIFEYLPIPDKIRIERVCRKWKNLNKSYWRNIKELDLDHYTIHFNSYAHGISEIKKVNTKFVISVIKRCGIYINSFDFGKCDSTINCSKVLKIIAKYCCNITNISFSLFSAQYRNLKLVLSNNKKIRSLCFYSTWIYNENYLPYLQTDIVEELSLIDCQFDPTYDLKNFLLSFKKLKKFEIESNFDYLNVVINKMILSGNNNIVDFTITYDKFAYLKSDLSSKELNVDKLSEFLSKQNNLKKLVLCRQLKIDEKFMQNLPPNLEEIENFNLYESTSFYLPNFQKLKMIFCHIPKLTDKCIQRITECRNLIDLTIYNVDEYMLSPLAESYFSKLQNLEIFSLSAPDHNVDNILISLGECKNLKDISVRSCKFSDTGLVSISSLPKIEKLNFSGTEITYQQLSEFIMPIKQLKRIDIWRCKNLTDHSDNIKKQFKDTLVTCYV